MSFVKSLTGKDPNRISADQDRTRIIISFAMLNHGAVFAHWLRNQLMQRYALYGTTTVYLDSVACRDAGSELPKVYCKLNPDYVRGSDPPCMKYLPETFMINPKFDKKGKVGPGNLWYIRDPNAKHPLVPTLEEAKRKGAPPIYVDPKTGAEEVAFTLVMPDMRPGDDDPPNPDGSEGEKKSRSIGAMLQTWDKKFQAAMAEAEVMIFCYTEEWRLSGPCAQEWNQFQQLNFKRALDRKQPVRAIVLNFTNRNIPPTVNGPNVTRLDVDKEPCWLTERDDYILKGPDLINLVKLIGKLS